MPLPHSDVSPRPNAASADSLSFLVVGDWGREGSPAQREVAGGMDRMARRLGSRLVVSTGDNFYEDGVTDVRDPQWRASFEDVYTAASLQTPWYAVLGNHDYRSSAEAQVAYTRHSARWRMPARYYAVTERVDPFTEVLLVFLDTTPFLAQYRPGGEEATPGVAGQDVGRQLDWLCRTLAGSAARWKVVVGHHAVLSGSPFHGGSEELDRAVAPLLEAYGVQLYLCGHEHDLQHLARRGVHYVVCGTGSECRETSATAHTRFCRGDLGFAAVTVDAHALRLRLCNAAGFPVYGATLPPVAHAEALRETAA